MRARLTDAEDLGRVGRLFWFTVEFGVIHERGVIESFDQIYEAAKEVGSRLG